MEPAIPYPVFLAILVILIGAVGALLTAPLWSKGVVFGIKLGRRSIAETNDTLNELKAPIHLHDKEGKE